ncbi:hypothetical protein CF319_g1314, partial [Tilletia indica]
GKLLWPLRPSQPQVLVGKEHPTIICRRSHL